MKREFERKFSCLIFVKKEYIAEEILNTQVSFLFSIMLLRMIVENLYWEKLKKKLRRWEWKERRALNVEAYDYSFAQKIHSVRIQAVRVSFVKNTQHSYTEKVWINIARRDFSIKFSVAVDMCLSNSLVWASREFRRVLIYYYIYIQTYIYTYRKK